MIFALLACNLEETREGTVIGNPGDGMTLVARSASVELEATAKAAAVAPPLGTVLRLDADRMPPLGSLVVDEAGAEILEAWIDGLESCE